MTKRNYDANGWYEVKNNPISKVGVFQYLGKNISPELEPDKVYNVYRPESALNNPETIESFKLVPWLPRHEMIGDGFTPAEDVGIEGTTGEQIYFKDGTLYGNIKVYGKKLANMIEDGIKELSLGFRCTWDIVSGTTPNGESYDVMQVGIYGNHLASVPEGRMGSSVAVMDASVFALDENDVIKLEPKPNGETMTLEEALAKIAELEAKLAAMAEDECAKDAEADPEEKAEDADAEEEKAEDMEEDKEKSEAMDAAIKSLQKEIRTLKSQAMDGNKMMKAFAAKQELANQASQIIGAFDHADMDAQGVAKYALKKMGVACDSGQEVAMLKGVLLARKTPTFTVDNGIAKDSAISAKSDNLDKAGL